MNKFAERLKFLRKVKGLSQVNLAKVIGSTQSTICKWEADMIEPKIDEIIKLAKYFGESTDFLLGADEI